MRPSLRIALFEHFAVGVEKCLGAVGCDDDLSKNLTLEVAQKDMTTGERYASNRLALGVGERHRARHRYLRHHQRGEEQEARGP